MVRSHFAGLAGRLLFLNLVRLVVAVLGLGVLAIAVFELRSVARWVDHSDRVLSQAAATERSVIDLETGARGYLLTSEVRFLEPTRIAEGRLPDELAALRRLAGDNVAQEARATAITKGVAAYRRSWLEPTLFPGPSGPAQMRLTLSRGKRQMDGLRVRFATFTAVERGLRTRREAHARLIQEIVAGLVIAVIAALVLSSLLTARWTRRRVVAPLLELRQIIEHFDATQSDPPRAAHDGFAEVGELARAFNTMADDLAQSRDRTEMLTAELAEQARTDSLTGLANRRQFDLELARACAAARRYQTPLSLLSLDLDQFKAINDTHGHAAGDDALRVVAAICRSNTRASDLIARVGGDEFAVLMPQTGRNGANTVAATIQQAVINHAAGATPGALRVSIGVASVMGNEADPHRLTTAADAEMYSNKRDAEANRLYPAQTRS